MNPAILIVTLGVLAYIGYNFYRINQKLDLIINELYDDGYSLDCDENCMHEDHESDSDQQAHTSEVGSFDLSEADRTQLWAFVSLVHDRFADCVNPEQINAVALEVNANRSHFPLPEWADKNDSVTEIARQATALLKLSG